MDKDVKVNERVLALLTTVLKCPVDLEDSRQNLAVWDSLKHIEVMFALEEEFDMQFSEQELSELSSVKELVQRLQGIHET